MIRRPALLKRLALEGALLAGLGGLAGDFSPPRPLPAAAPAFSLTPRVPAGGPPPFAEREKAFRAALGIGKEKTAQGLTDTAELLRLSFGVWPAPGVDFQPEIVRHVPVRTLSAFDGTWKTVEAATSGAGSFNEIYRNVASVFYPQAAAQLFQPPEIDARLLPLDTRDNALLDMSVEGHEALHALFRQQQILLDYLYDRPSLDRLGPDAMGRSELIGYGPEMDALLASGETPAQTSARHRALFQALGDGNPFTQTAAQGDDVLKTYPALYTEMQSYAHQIVAGGVSSGAWRRVPRTKEEVWAAFANAIGGLPPGGKDEVSAFLESEAGEKARAAFPAPPDVIGQRWLRDDVGFLPADKKSLFYSQVLPRLYGDLLEAYGDPQGRAKMGLPSGQAATLSFATHVVRAGEGGDQDWTPETWRKMAAQVDPQTLPRMAALAVAHHNPAAVEALLDTPAGKAALGSAEKDALLKTAFQVMLRSADANRREDLRTMDLLAARGAAR
ncbi:MAG: hypothetical protein PW734_02995 [Verrucomicrobium sp.]|nr:hypothetical protein [Verrucomicrobium sp.]